MTRPAALSVHLTLAAGECRIIQVVSGSRWTVTRGRVRLTEPLRALGERSVSLERWWLDGSSHIVEEGGWMKMQASTSSVLVVEAPALAARPTWRWPRWWPLVRRLIGT